MNQRRIISKFILTIIVTIIATIIARILIFDIYYIPSDSMQPELQEGDYILISKLHYGARWFKFFDFYKTRKIGYHRTPGVSIIKRNDIVVFDKPDYGAFNDSTGNTFGEIFCKRCMVCPGDTLLISNHLNPVSIQKADRVGKTIKADSWGVKN